jgi:multidrug efflux pump
VLLSERARILAQLPELIVRAGIPNGVAIKASEDSNEASDSMWSLWIATFTAGAIIYFIMCILYESLLAPLTMMTTIPAGIISVLGIYTAAQLPMNPRVILGLFLLVGIVINHGVVLVDRMTTTVPMFRFGGRTSDRTATIAIAAAARRRFTPVLLTSLTTIAAAVPMSFSHGRIFGQPIASLGLSLGIGLVAATVFTLVMVPIVYQWLAFTRAGTITLFTNRRP